MIREIVGKLRLQGYQYGPRAFPSNRALEGFRGLPASAAPSSAPAAAAHTGYAHSTASTGAAARPSHSTSASARSSHPTAASPSAHAAAFSRRELSVHLPGP